MDDQDTGRLEGEGGGVSRSEAVESRAPASGETDDEVWGWGNSITISSGIGMSEEEGQLILGAEAETDPGDFVRIGPGLAADVIEQGGELGPEGAGICLVVIHGDSSEAHLAHLAQGIAAVEQGAARAMGIKDDRERCGGALRQHRDTFHSAMAGDGDREANAAERITSAGPQQGAGEGQGDCGDKKDGFASNPHSSRRRERSPRRDLPGGRGREVDQV